MGHLLNREVDRAQSVTANPFDEEEEEKTVALINEGLSSISLQADLDKITPTVPSHEASHMSPTGLHGVTKSSCAPDVTPLPD
ncbi:hypothetical protein VZT92_010256 [Zoarces viviparus]|uniref:Uncharacterized protein n=1 Tax=Zoarces viviparus TaxID=48416 RepID=A0AAW1FFA7_ZOAVI